MRTTRQLSVTLPTRMADMVREKVASGANASESEVVRDGLRALLERDAAAEQWLRNEVMPSLRAYEADPSNVVPIEEVFDGLETRRLARQRRGP
jgi:putative addiction module CopG family antidote